MGRPLDLIGQRFGKIIVISEVEPHYTKGGSKQRQWKCRCDCGMEFVATTQNLRSGDTKSCGCYKREIDKERATTHGQTGTKLYSIWKAMKKRCNNQNNSDYKYYGAKGICVCEEWNDSFEVFAKWANENGYSENLTIDRIDNNKNYCPSNCRWIDFKSQCNNRTSNIYITYNGFTKTLSEWSETTGISYSALYYRIRQGKTIKEVIDNKNNSNN